MKKITKQDISQFFQSLPAKAKRFFKAFPSVAWNILKTYWIWIVVAIVLLVADLVTKHIVASNLKLGQSVEIIHNFFNISYTLNTGASFGMLQNWQGAQILFLIITPIALILFFFLLFTSKKYKLVYKLALAMIIAGTIGNYVDRIAFGAVRDFVEIVYFGYYIPYLGESFAIFNIADACLVIGTIIFAIYYIFFIGFKEDKKEPAVVSAPQQSMADGKKEPAVAPQQNMADGKKEPAVESASQAKKPQSPTEQSDPNQQKIQSENQNNSHQNSAQKIVQNSQNSDAENSQNRAEGQRKDGE